MHKQKECLEETKKTWILMRKTYDDRNSVGCINIINKNDENNIEALKTKWGLSVN